MVGVTGVNSVGGGTISVHTVQTGKKKMFISSGSYFPCVLNLFDYISCYQTLLLSVVSSEFNVLSLTTKNHKLYATFGGLIFSKKTLKTCNEHKGPLYAAHWRVQFHAAFQQLE